MLAASSAEFPAVQLTMVDDTMEISSEYGHNVEQGDIDIDLDITGGQVDEDYVLEDATSHIDFGDEFHPQPSPAVNDDLMLDDDNESFSMEDADLLNEGGERITDQESMSFATVDGDASHLHGTYHESVRPMADATNHHSAPYEQQDGLTNDAIDYGLQQDVSDEILQREDDQFSDVATAQESASLHGNAQVTDEVDLPSSEAVTKAVPKQFSRTPSPDHHSPAPTAPAEPRSPPASVPDLRQSSPEAASSHPGSNINPNSLHSNDDPVESVAVKDASGVRDVTVVYRDMEYALFSTSDLDDPDSFFFSDRSIAEKPLSEFFRAIREVIHKDLIDEDELCLCVESLGLETEEGFSFVEEVTLSQVLDLHASLLQNDGVESPGPCYMLLRTRPSFSRRFSNLIEGAAQGKGLSELVAWDDDESQAADLSNSEDPESKYDYQSNLKSPVLGGVDEDHKDTAGLEEVENTYEHDAAGQEYGQEQQQDLHSELQITQAALPAASASAENTGTKASGSGSPLPRKDALTSGDVDEDGDLIDYSEDEAEIPKNQNRSVSGTGELNTDGHRTDNEYEEKNEDLRRRSLSRATTEDKLPEQSTDQSLETTEESAKRELSDENTSPDEHFNEDENGEYSEENGYDQFSEGIEYGDENAKNEGSAAVEVAETYIENDDYDPASHEHFGGGEDYIQDDFDHTHEQGVDDESGIENYLLNDFQFVDEENRLEDSMSHGDKYSAELNDASEVDTQPANALANSLDVAETAESSVTMGADEIQYEDDLLEAATNNSNGAEEPSKAKGGPESRVVLEQQKDEIDYEEDEDEDEDEQSPALTGPGNLPEAKGFSNANGKRSIADVDSNDAQTSQAKDAKRRRS